MSEEHDHIFVYGTLRGGESNHDLIPNCGGLFVAHSRTRHAKFDMMSMGAFPAVTTGVFFIEGEVYRIPVSALPSFDRLEGVPYCYVRQRIELEGMELKPWMYIATSIIASMSCYDSDQIKLILQDTKVWLE